MGKAETLSRSAFSSDMGGGNGKNVGSAKSKFKLLKENIIKRVDRKTCDEFFLQKSHSFRFSLERIKGCDFSGRKFVV